MKKFTFRLSRKLIGTGAAVALAVALIIAVATTEGDDEVTVTGLFADASPLVQGNTVQLDGVPVGKISSIRLEHGAARVEMKVDKSTLPLHFDAKARIQVRSLLGERFIELDRGSSNRPEMDAPYTIGRKSTERQVSLDELLNSVDDPTGTALAALLTTAGEGTAGEGKNIDAAIKGLEPAMRNTEQLGKVLGDQNDVLASLTEKVSPVTQALANGRGADLDHLVGSANQALSTVDSRRIALNSTLKHLPATLQQAQKTLNQVAGVADSTSGTLRDVRPVTQGLPDIKKELDDFNTSAGPALTSLPDVLSRARELIDQAAPAVRDLRPGANSLPSVSSSADHLTSTVAPELETALQFAQFWALANNQGDGMSHYFRAALAVTPKELLNVVDVPAGPGQGAAPPQPQQPALEAKQHPQTPSEPHGGEPNKDTGSATGLTEGQEHTLIQQLLGGN